MKKSIKFIVLLACCVCTSCPALHRPTQAIPSYCKYQKGYDLPPVTQECISKCCKGSQYDCYFASKYFNNHSLDKDDCMILGELLCNACNGAGLSKQKSKASLKQEDFPEKESVCKSCSLYQKIFPLRSECDSGIATSCTDLYYVLENLTSLDICPFYIKRKEAFLIHGCTKGDPRACKRDYERRKQAAQKAGSSEPSFGPLATLNAMQAMEDAQSVRDPIKKRAAYQKGCKSPAIEGDSHLSAWFESGACFNWGVMLLQGEGGEVNIELAKKAFAMSCQKGVADGCRALSEINNQ